jgi:hypothetical protein
MDTTILLAIVAFVVVLIVIVVLWYQYFSWNSKKSEEGEESNYGLQEFQLEKSKTNGLIHTYSLGNHKKFILKKGDFFMLTIPNIGEYFEFQALDYSSKQIVFSLSYLNALSIAVDDKQLHSGSYTFQIKTTATILPAQWSDIKIVINPTVNSQPGIAFHKPVGGRTDAHYYNDLGDLHFEKCKKLYDKNYEYVYSAASKVQFEGRENSQINEYELKLDYDQIALLVVANRQKTMGNTVEAILAFNDKIQVEEASDDTFHTYKINGKHLSTLNIREYLLGCNSHHHILPFYVYVYQKSK